MDIYSNNPLVPYYQGPQHVTPYMPVVSRSVSADGNPAVKRYTPMLPPHSSKYETRADGHESAYNSRRRLMTSKINQVGLRIDIYA